MICFIVFHILLIRFYSGSYFADQVYCVVTLRLMIPDPHMISASSLLPAYNLHLQRPLTVRFPDIPRYISPLISSAQRVGFFNIGWDRVGQWTKYRVAGRVRVGQECQKIQSGISGYLFLLSDISGYFGYFRVCQVFSGISGFTNIYQGYLLTFNGG